MATIAEFTLPADGFPLGTVFSNLPDVTVELERVIPDLNGVVPYFWVQGTDSESIVEEFSDHPGVRDIREVDHVEDDYLMRCEWVSGHDGLLDALVAPDIVLLSAIGTADEWTFHLRGESREVIAEFRQNCLDNDIEVTLTELHALRATDTTQGLTEGQLEALLLAYERGYYDTPRATTLKELAEELGVTQQALGSRLKRGYRRFIEHSLTES